MVIEGPIKNRPSVVFATVFEVTFTTAFVAVSFQPGIVWHGVPTTCEQ